MEPDKKSATGQLLEYTENTTIHGIKYLGQRHRPIIEKIFWIIIFVINLIILGFFVNDVLRKFSQKSVIMVDNEQPTSIHAIPFPAVTVCPVFKIKTDFFKHEDVLKWLLEESEENMIEDWAFLLCNQQFINTVFGTGDGKNETKYLNQSHIELLHKVSPNIQDLFKDVNFAGKKEIKFIYSNAIQIEVPFSFILTNEGICFTFNVPSEIIADEPSLQTDYKYHDIRNKSIFWDHEHGFNGYPKFPRSVWGSGPQSGLNFLMAADANDLNTICQPTQIGYKIVLHSPDEYPTTLGKFISVPHNTMAQIQVTPKITKTSYDLSNLHPEKRQCYFDRDRKLKYFTFYSRVNCKLECAANYSMQQYGCVHFSLPRNSSQPICGPDIKITDLYNAEEIMNSYLQYNKEITDRYKSELVDGNPLKHETNLKLNCNCLPACNSIEYDYNVEMENMEMEKVLEKYFLNNNTSENTAPIVMIDIFFGMTKVVGKTRKQYYTFSDLISNIGGLVGLFMGASIISITEIVYFFVVR